MIDSLKLTPKGTLSILGFVNQKAGGDHHHSRNLAHPIKAEGDSECERWDRLSESSDGLLGWTA